MKQIKKISLVLFIIISIIMTSVASLSASNYDDTIRAETYDRFAEAPAMPAMLAADVAQMSKVALFVNADMVMIVLSSNPVRFISNEGNGGQPNLLAVRVVTGIDMIVYTTMDGQQWTREIFDESGNQFGYFGFTSHKNHASVINFIGAEWSRHRELTKVVSTRPSVLSVDITSAWKTIAYSNYNVYCYKSFWGGIDGVMSWTEADMNVYGTLQNEYLESDHEKNIQTAIMSLWSEWNGVAYVPPYEPPTVELPALPELPERPIQMPTADLPTIEPIEDPVHISTGIDIVDGIVNGMIDFITFMINTFGINSMNALIFGIERLINTSITVYNWLINVLYDVFIVPTYNTLKAIYEALETLVNKLIAANVNVILWVFGDTRKITVAIEAIKAKFYSFFPASVVSSTGQIILPNPFTQAADWETIPLTYNGTIAGVGVNAPVVPPWLVTDVLMPFRAPIRAFMVFCLAMAWYWFIIGFIGQKKDGGSDDS